jgi:hypothetical protein
VAECSPHHSKTEGLSPAAAADTAKDRIVNKIDQLATGSQRKMINDGKRKNKLQI